MNTIALGSIGHSQFTDMVLWHNNEEIKEGKQAPYDYMILRQ
jgi:hypothetical protein